METKAGTEEGREARAREVVLLGVRLPERRQQEGASQLRSEKPVQMPGGRKAERAWHARDATCDWGLGARGEQQETK